MIAPVRVVAPVKVYVCDLCQDSGLTLVVIKDANLNNFYVTGPYTLETCPNCKGITAEIYS